MQNTRMPAASASAASGPRSARQQIAGSKRDDGRPPAAETTSRSAPPMPRLVITCSTRIRDPPVTPSDPPTLPVTGNREILAGDCTHLLERRAAPVIVELRLHRRRRHDP